MEDFLHLLQLCLCELHPERCRILFQVLNFFRPRDWKNILSLSLHRFEAFPYQLQPTFCTGCMCMCKPLEQCSIAMCAHSASTYRPAWWTHSYLVSCSYVPYSQGGHDTLTKCQQKRSIFKSHVKQAPATFLPIFRNQGLVCTNCAAPHPTTATLPATINDTTGRRLHAPRPVRAVLA